MLKVIICLAVFILSACGDMTSPSVTASPVNSNQSAVEPAPTATPANASAVCDEQRLTGLPENVHVPAELCLDRNKPIDKGEDYTAQTPLPSNALKQEYDIPFNDLPAVVQRVIRLTGDEKLTGQTFAHYVILSDDDSQPGKRSVKTYRYVAAAGIPSWDFKRQGKALKLDSAELKEAPSGDNAGLKTYTLMCSSRRAYMLPSSEAAPNLPLDLCFDEQKEVDKSEFYKVSKNTPVNSVLDDKQNIPFEQLPADVQNIIRLTSGERNVNKKFYVTTLIDYISKSLTPGKSFPKSYFYYLKRESSQDESWLFKKQNDRYKLTQAQLSSH